MPAIEIDTELANAQYENQHDLDLELQMEEDALEDTANGAAGAYPQNDNMQNHGAQGESPGNEQDDLQDN